MTNSLRSSTERSFLIRFFFSLFSTGFRQYHLRNGLVFVVFAGLFCVISGRLVQLAVRPDPAITARQEATHAVGPKRPDVLDRNGVLLATDIDTASLYAEPKRILDVDEATELLTAVLPSLNSKDLRDKLASKKGFVWLRRELTPKQQADIHRLGIPGLGFVRETKRVYPNGTTLAHVVGSVDIDNKGIAGIERTLDARGMVEAGKPVHLSIDLRAQHILREELLVAKAKFSAIAASGVVYDVKTGEIVALVSLPDFDPNDPGAALNPDYINRMTVGVYEMGSTFKALTTAMALDSGKVNLASHFDARAPMQYGRFRISDFHAQKRVLSVPEVFIHSSNIGTAKMALTQGVEAHQNFLRKMGQLDRLRTELPESAEPLLPRRWVELNTVTIAFGHGLSVAPLQAVMATGALVNGGSLIPPTIFKRSEEEARLVARPVLKPSTSNMMRYLMRLNVERGSGSRANVAGYLVGGKTGTAEKSIGGRYVKNKLISSFMASFPMDDPRFVTLIMLDEPKGLPETFGYATAGWTAAPATGRLVERLAPVLGISPRHHPFEPPVPAADMTATILPKAVQAALPQAKPSISPAGEQQRQAARAATAAHASKVEPAVTASGPKLTPTLQSVRVSASSGSQSKQVKLMPRVSSPSATRLVGEPQDQSRGPTTLLRAQDKGEDR